MMTAHRSRAMTPPESAFVGFRFPPEVIVSAVRWYLRFGLPHRGVEWLLAERGVEVDHVTVYCWVLRFTPLLAESARAQPPRRRYPLTRGRDLHQGRWPLRYVYRTIDQFGQAIDVYVSPRQNRTDRYANNRAEADHGQLMSRLRPMCGLKQDRSARVILAGHALVQNLCRGHDELAIDEPANRRLAVAFTELAMLCDPARS